MADWITSGRIGAPDKLKEWEAILRAADNFVQTANIATRVLQQVAEAEAYVDNFSRIVSGKKMLALSADVLVSDLIGGFLDDAGYLLVHSNLRRVLDRFGVAPFLKGAEVDRIVSTDPVRTQFPTPYTGLWWRMNSARLGSSTINALDRMEWGSGFDLWQEDVLAAFDDAGDFQRPAYGESEELAALVITTQAADPVEYFDKFATLLKLFSKKPAELVLPEFAFHGLDLEKEGMEFDLGMMATAARLRPHLTSEGWNTPPDFVRLSTKDMVPLIGDYLLGMFSLKAEFDSNLAIKVSLEGIGTAAAAYIERMERILSQAREILSYLVAILSQPGMSRLWIPLDAGGHARIQAEIEAAEDTRQDLQRIVEPSLSGLTRNELIAKADAVAIKAGDVAFRFTPVENLLVGGMVVVLHPGALYTLFESLFAPTAEDIAESEGGPRVVPDYDLFTAELGAPPRSPLPTTEAPLTPGDAPGPRGRPVDPPGVARSGWVTTPVVSERPVGPSGPLTGGVLSRTRTPHSAVYPSSDGAAVQMIAAGTPRSSVLRYVGDEATQQTVLVAGGESRGARLVDGSNALTEPTSSPTDAEVLLGDRVPVGDAPASPEQALSGVLQARPLAFDRDAATHVVASAVTILGAGARVQIPDLDAYVTGLGYGGGLESLGPMHPGRLPWWVDVRVEWENDGVPRQAVVRTQLHTVNDTAPFTYTCVPSLPAAPVIASDATTGVAVVGPRLGVVRDLAPRADSGTRDDFVEVDSPGVTFETVLGLRRRGTDSSDEPDAGLFSTLQAEVSGNIVDGDTGAHGRQRGILMGRTAQGDMTYVSPFDLAAGDRIHSKIPMTTLLSSEVLSVGDRPSLEPLFAAREAYGRTEAPVSFPYFRNDLDEAAAETFDHRYATSDRIGDADQDSQLLTARASRWVRIGLGTVDLAPRTVPAAATSAEHRVFIISGGKPVLVPNAVNAGVIPGGIVQAVSTFDAVYGGEDWYIEFRWDSKDATVRGVAIPHVLVTAEDVPATRDDADPSMADEILMLPGTELSARFGATLAGESVLSSSGRFGDECVWVNARALVGVARVQKVDQARKASLSFVFMDSPEGSEAVWTLLETPSHVLALNVETVPVLEVYERDLIDGTWVRRNALSIAAPAPGVMYRADLTVDPDAGELTLEWWKADPVGGPTAAFALQFSDVHAPAAGARSRVRALDGYPLPGATIRVGRPRPPMQLDVRTGAPYLDLVTVEVASSPKTLRWAWGSFPVALLALAVVKP